MNPPVQILGNFFLYKRRCGFYFSFSPCYCLLLLPLFLQLITVAPLPPLSNHHCSRRKFRMVKKKGATATASAATSATGPKATTAASKKVAPETSAAVTRDSAGD
jgi:hypothetical protein